MPLPVLPVRLVWASPALHITSSRNSRIRESGMGMSDMGLGLCYCLSPRMPCPLCHHIFRCGVRSGCQAPSPGWRRSGCAGTVYAEPEDNGRRLCCHGPDGMLAAAHEEGEPDEIQQTC